MLHDHRAGNEEMETVATQFFKTGVIGNTHLFAAFVPLLQKGKIKKAIAVSSGHAALDIINAVGLENAAFYAAAKAAQNIIVAKFSVQYKDEGILFMSVSPGVVDTGMLNQGRSSFPRVQSFRPASRSRLIGG